MLRLTLLVFLLAHRTQTAHITETPSYVNRFDRLYEKLEKLTTPDRKLGPSPEEKLYEKLDRLNSLTPERLDLTEEDEELLSAMQTWGKFSPAQMVGVVKDLQRIKEEERKEIDQEYSEPDWNDEDSDSSESEDSMYANDDWDPEDPADSSSTSKPYLLGLSPSAIIRTSGAEPEDENVVLAAESIAATNARPRIMPIVTASERTVVRRAALQSTSSLLRNSKCLEPQPRWLTVRQLAPAADTGYMPPCVQLHRCAPDAGCCINESEVSAPIDGKTVDFPFFLQKADGVIDSVKMQFFNHTKCACVSRDKLEHMTTRVGKASFSDVQEEQTPRTLAKAPKRGEPFRKAQMPEQGDWRRPPVEPSMDKSKEVTAPPQLRRCTCPALFLANMTDTAPCSCVCDWPDILRRRDCQSLARGKEHFGLRDRVCVDRGDCTPPSCEFGAYDRNNGQCPQRRYRRLRFHGRGRYQPEKTVVV